MIRTIILYNISIIEALLLFRAKKEKIQFNKLLYKIPTVLPKGFQHTSDKLVVAYQKNEKRDSSEIWLHELIREQQDFLGVSLHSEIKSLQGIRNTFHLSAARNALNFQSAESSFDTVLKLVEKLQKS